MTKVFTLLTFLSLLLAGHCIPAGQRPHPIPSENFPFHTSLDRNGDYLLYWKFNATHITFETHVRTKGYVGFGFSPNGNMYPSDVVIGWVKDGVVHFKDRHAVGHSTPVVDASQDWILLHGEENNFGTVLKMVRKLDTCDKDDMKISNDTIRAIYSFNSNDPADENSISYHGATNRGSKSLMLLTQVKHPVMPSDVMTKDFLNDNYHVPSDDTTYACRVFSLTSFDKKYHIVKFEPIIQPGNEELVHHFILYKCPAVDPKYMGYEYVGDAGPSPCGNVFIAWAVGGTAFYFPDDVGLPIGEPGDTDVFILETHYNNPARRSDWVDSSGVRVLYTPTLKTHDAGLLTSGVMVHPWQIIPPQVPDFRSVGFCSENCLRKGLDKFKDGVKVFAVQQHAHLLGRGIRTRLYRNGVEQEPLAYDENYDFNFQDYRYLNKRRTLKSGDSVVVECKYDSTGRSNVTIGGLATTNEMCLAFLFYYPRMDVEMCESIPIYDNVNQDYTKVSSILAMIDWNNKTALNSYLENLNNSRYIAMCKGRRLQPNVTYPIEDLPRLKTEYVEPSTCPKDAHPTVAKAVTTAAVLNPNAVPKPSEAFPFKSSLDKNGNYLLYWKVNSSHITFEVHVRTHGYVGFGFSPNGNMYPADIVIGWIKDGKTYVKDRHSEGHFTPAVDASQDWFLLYGEENDFGTVLKMVRKLDTCDKDDIKITNDTIRAIYSFNPNDPADENSIPYHGATNRGAKSLMLLTQVKHPAMPSDAMTKDFLNDNYHVPSSDTTYACRVFSLADFDKKYHIVKFEPIIQPGNEAIVHHFILYKCPAVDPKYIGYEYVGNAGPRPCGNAFVAWAVGGTAFYYPEDVGMPIGEPGDTDVFILETHYNNPTRRSDWVDSSGFRITYTPTLKTYDAGLLTTGVMVHPWQIIPPNMPEFRSVGFCSEGCLHKGLDKFKDGVKVFAVQQHAHLLGRGIRTRLYRNGVEQEPLAYDENYDFNFQDYRYLNKRRTLKSGDSVVVECKYDSTGRSNVTTGGLATHNEMCLAFLFYYPRMDVELCESIPVFDSISSDSHQINTILRTIDWHNKTVINMYLDKLNSSRYVARCKGHRLHPRVAHPVEDLPRPKVEYVEPSSCPTKTNPTAKIVTATTKATTTTKSTAVTAQPTINPNSVPRPTEAFPFKETLDKSGNYLLYWKVNSTHITFEVHVRTHGYVGFGLSPNGNMYPADVVIGWVKDGKSYFKDRHTVAYGEPLIDSSQDWYLLHAEENDFGTVLKTVRMLDTCDNNDLKITEATTRIIYSYHPDDPQGETGLPYHGNTRRGAHSLMLLSKMPEVKMPIDVITRDLLNDNFHVPPVETHYHCRLYDMRDLGKKHHLIAFEPVVQKGNENVVHHIVVYKCPGMNRNYIGRSYSCSNPPAQNLDVCNVFYLAWATGGEMFQFPENVGLPLGDPTDQSLYIIQTHYNNPSKQSGYVDNSGLRLYLTPTLRQYDAGVLTAGVSVNPYQIIPPFEPHFVSSGFCSENCLKKGLDSMPNGVKVFAILQHAHLLARGIKTRLIRKGVEQEPLADDKHYDFDFQDMRYISKNRTIEAGDSVVVECTYDSTNRTTETYGGQGTSNEMCQSFIYYYPSMAVETCQAEPLYDDIPIPHSHLLNQAHRYNWTDPKHRETFKQYLANTHYNSYCVGMSLSPAYSSEKVLLPASRYSYQPPKSRCAGN